MSLSLLGTKAKQGRRAGLPWSGNHGVMNIFVTIGDSSVIAAAVVRRGKGRPSGMVQLYSTSEPGKE
jgi:hypothetical protein